MSAQCLILSQDSALLGHLQSALGPHGTSLHFRQDSASAIAFASRRHLDGFVIDCDDVAGGVEAIAQLRAAPGNKPTLMLVFTNGLTSTDEALHLGADFVLSKPIQPARLRTILDILIPRMEREHRRYFRHHVDLPVRVQNLLGQSFRARMQNVSEGGLAIKLNDSAKLTGIVALEFELPSVEPQVLHSRAEVVWSDSFLTGLRFLYVEKRAGVALQAWLTSLEAGSRLHGLAQQN